MESSQEIIITIEQIGNKDILEYLKERYPEFVKEKEEKHYIIEKDIRIKADEYNIPIVFGVLGRNIHTTFMGNVTLQCRYFNSDVFFQECEFHQNFSAMACNFRGNVYFDNAKFDRFFIATDSAFMQKVGFWNVIFKEIPNFSRVSFDKLDFVNFVGIDIEDSYDKTKELIRNESSDISKDLRDSFRIIKHSLIRQDNLLDASKFHRIELYCKEIELDSKKPKIFSKEWIDNIVLKFYRLTSDHHTDLPKIIGWVITLIGICGLLLFVSRYGLDIEKFSQYHKDNGLVSLFQQLPCAILERTKTIIHLLYFLIFCSVFFTPFRILIYGFIALCMICVAPKYILGVGGFIGGAIYSKGALENLLLVTYSLLLFLFVFSLQKTARKNSIIPN
ncbi:MAG TPA: pentapeptide repeat-containing protein [Candidatus Helicobacter avicola]|nr:pentapeptide repeat-containing protein [Candidatus Helicobacter avicola]